jgi:hypothetical protein
VLHFELRVWFDFPDKYPLRFLIGPRTDLDQMSTILAKPVTE